MTDIEHRLRTSDVQIDSRGTLYPRVNCKPSPTAICGNSTLTLDDCGISNQDLFQLVDDGSFGGQVDLDWTPNPGVGLSDAILTVEDDLGQSASCKTTLDITAPLCVRPSDGSVVERVLATSVDGDSTAIGVLFDVQSADETILMKGLDLNINTADVVAVEVWGREGSYIEWDDGNWELLMTANVSGRGPQNLTPLGFFAEPVVIDPNTTRGFYATLTGVDSAILYSDAGIASQWRSGNSDLRVVNSAPVNIYPLNHSYTESFWNQSIPNIALRYTAGMASVFVTISHDFWPSETGWRLQRVVGDDADDFELIFDVPSSPAAANADYTWEVLLLPGTYTLQLFDIFGDGITDGRYQLSYQSTGGYVVFYDSDLSPEGTTFTTQSKLVWFNVENDQSMTTSKWQMATRYYYLEHACLTQFYNFVAFTSSVTQSANKCVDTQQELTTGLTANSWSQYSNDGFVFEVQAKSSPAFILSFDVHLSVASRVTIAVLTKNGSYLRTSSLLEDDEWTPVMKTTVSSNGRGILAPIECLDVPVVVASNSTQSFLVTVLDSNTDLVGRYRSDYSSHTQDANLQILSGG